MLKVLDHGEYQRRLRSKSVSELLWIIKDSKMSKSYSGTRAKRDHVNPVGEHLTTHSVTNVNGKFNAVWMVGTRSDSRMCDTQEEADIFIQNGIRAELGFPPLGLKGGLER